VKLVHLVGFIIRILPKNLMAHKEGKKIITPQHSKAVTTTGSSG
jgi:hypothetical protein